MPCGLHLNTGTRLSEGAGEPAIRKKGKSPKIEERGRKKHRKMGYRPYSSTTTTFDEGHFITPGVQADLLCPRFVRLPGVRGGFHTAKDRT